MADEDMEVQPNEAERDPFLITSYIEQPVLVGDIPLQIWFREQFVPTIPDVKRYRIAELLPVESNVHLFLNQVSDMISPEIVDCRDLGWIACNSVISKLYAKGATQCDSIMMHLRFSTEMERVGLRDTMISRIVEGFCGCAEREEAKVAYGLLDGNEFLWIGGVASSLHPVDDYMVSDKAENSNAIVLTKPLGTLIAARYKYMVDHRLRAPSEDVAFNSHVDEAYELAVRVMRRSNKDVAALMKSHGVRAVIDVNGRSLLQCAEKLLGMQHRPLYLRFDEMPVIQHTPEIARVLGIDLIGGEAPELSGGLMICIPYEKVRPFISALRGNEHFVGRVFYESEGHARGSVHFRRGLNPFEVREHELN